MPVTMWWGKTRRTLTRWKAAEPVATATPQVGIWHSMAYYGTAATWLRMAQWLWRWSSTFVIYPLPSHDDDFKNIKKKMFWKCAFFSGWLQMNCRRSLVDGWSTFCQLASSNSSIAERWAAFSHGLSSTKVSIWKVSILFSLQQKK